MCVVFGFAGQDEPLAVGLFGISFVPETVSGFRSRLLQAKGQ